MWFNEEVQVTKGLRMAQSHAAKKDVKKKAQKTLKQKRLDKKVKKATKVA